VECYHLGQGGVIGRYPFHSHGPEGPAPSQSPKYDGKPNRTIDPSTNRYALHQVQDKRRGLLVRVKWDTTSIGQLLLTLKTHRGIKTALLQLGVESSGAVDENAKPAKSPASVTSWTIRSEVFPSPPITTHAFDFFWITIPGRFSLQHAPWVLVHAELATGCHPRRYSGPSLYETGIPTLPCKTAGRAAYATLN